MKQSKGSRNSGTKVSMFSFLFNFKFLFNFRFLFVVMFFVVMSLNLSAFVSSRIEGVVVDKETGKPIEGAKVMVCGNVLGFELQCKETKTDERGFYAIEKLIREGKYYVRVFKDGYVSNIEEYQLDSYLFHKMIEKYEFEIKKGDIKRINIGLERGGDIELKVNKKDKNGLNIYSGGLDIKVYKKYEEGDPEPTRKYGGYIIRDRYFDRVNGNGRNLKIRNLKPSDKYFLKIRGRKKTYVTWPVRVDNVIVRKGEVTKVECVFDLDKTGAIEGRILRDGEPVATLMVFLTRVDENYSEGFSDLYDITSKDGKFSFKLLPQGLYEISYFHRDEHGKEKKRRLKVQIGSVEKRKIEIRY